MSEIKGLDELWVGAEKARAPTLESLSPQKKNEGILSSIIF